MLRKIKDRPQLLNLLFLPTSVIFNSVYFILQYRFWNSVLTEPQVNHIIFAQSFASLIQFATAGMQYFILYTMTSQKREYTMGQFFANTIILTFIGATITFLLYKGDMQIVLSLYLIYFFLVNLTLVLGAYLDIEGVSYKKNAAQAFVWILSLLLILCMTYHPSQNSYFIPLYILLLNQALVLIFIVFQLRNMQTLKLEFRARILVQSLPMFVASAIPILLDPINKHFLLVNTPALLISFEFSNKLLQQVNGILVSISQSLLKNRSKFLDKLMLVYTFIAFAITYAALPHIMRYSKIILEDKYFILAISLAWMFNSLFARKYVELIRRNAFNSIIFLNLFLLITLIIIYLFFPKLSGYAWVIALCLNALLYYFIPSSQKAMPQPSN